MSYGCKCGCETFKEHIGNGPFIASAARPTSPSAVKTNRAITGEKYFAKDRDAYKAMKEQGIQPERLRGAHIMADQAKDKFEIESGELMDAKQVKIEKEVQAFMKPTKKVANV